MPFRPAKILTLASFFLDINLETVLTDARLAISYLMKIITQFILTYSYQLAFLFYYFCCLSTFITQYTTGIQGVFYPNNCKVPFRLFNDKYCT